MKYYSITYFMAGDGTCYDHNESPKSLTEAKRIAEWRMRREGYCRAWINETKTIVVTPKRKAKK